MTIKKFAIFFLVSVLLTSCNLPGIPIEVTQDPTGTDAPDPTATGSANATATSSSSPTGTESEAAISVVEMSLVEESAEQHYEIQAVWPNLSGISERVSLFNQEIDRMVQEAHDDFLNAVEERNDQGENEDMPVTSTLAIDYELTYQSHNLYSVHLTINSYIAVSAHPFTYSRALNYDADQAVFLSLSDLFQPSADHFAEIAAEVNSVLAGRDLGYEIGVATDVMYSRENWNILPEGLRINFDAYEVAPGAAGPQFVLISWAQLSGMIDQNGPASIFVEK